MNASSGYVRLSFRSTRIGLTARSLVRFLSAATELIKQILFSYETPFRRKVAHLISISSLFTQSGWINKANDVFYNQRDLILLK